MPGALITAVEGDTALTLQFGLSDARDRYNLSAVTSVALKMRGLSATCTVTQGAFGLCQVLVPSTFTAVIGNFHAELLTILDTNDQYFPSESPIFVEILPHTRSRA